MFPSIMKARSYVLGGTASPNPYPFESTPSLIYPLNVESIIIKLPGLHSNIAPTGRGYGIWLHQFVGSLGNADSDRPHGYPTTTAADLDTGGETA